MAVGYALLAAAEQGAGPGANALLYVVPVVVLVFARVSKSQAAVGRVRLDESGPGATLVGLHLGRLRDIFHVASWATNGLFLGCAFGFQWGLIYFTHDHAGLPVEGGFLESFLLTLDNLSHGVFLDTFELYGLHLGPKVEHSWRSASVFYAFRLAFDALVLLILYGAYQRYRIGHLFWYLPHDLARPDDLLGWLDAVCQDQHKWPARFVDEFLFLVLAKEYARGNYELVRQVSRQFPWLTVARPVRNLFRDADGEPIFHGTYEED
jgi:hypothetical protein